MLANEWVSVLAQVLLRKIWLIYYSRAPCPANTNLKLMRSIYPMSFLHIKSPTVFFNFISSKEAQQLKASCCRALFWCYWIYFEQVKYRKNESKSKQHESFYPRWMKHLLKYIFILINETKINTKSEGLGVANYVSLLVWTLALGLLLPRN